MGLPGPTGPLEPLGPLGPRTPGTSGTQGTPSNLRDPLELPDVMREKDFSGITVGFVYLRGYNFKLSLQ